MGLSTATTTLAGPEHVSMTGKGGSTRYDHGSRARWAWQSIPVLQLPPVQTGVAISALEKSAEESLSRRSPSLMARVESRLLHLKGEDNGVENALRTAEEILRLRRREVIGKWVNANRNFVQENRCQTAGPACCRKRQKLEHFRRAKSLREERQTMVVRLRDARQRSLIAKKGEANREIRKQKSARDRLFTELVYRKIFTRTGGVMRAWTVVVAHVSCLRYLEGALEKAARQRLINLNESRIAIVSRFICRTVFKRRRNKAVKVMVGALSAFTNSNAIGRYARRVKSSTRCLQGLVRGRLTCMSSHLKLLSRQWDRLYPPVPLPSSRPSAALPASSLGTSGGTKTRSSVSPGGGKRPSRRRGGGGQGGQKGGKGRQKSRRSVASGERGGDGSRVRGAVVGPAQPKLAEDGISDLVGVDRGDSLPRYVSSKAKQDEIYAWIKRAQSQHFKDVLNYERFTIFPCMVELLLQHERSTYRTRLQAIKHVTELRTSGRLSRTWITGGYFAKMSHVLPPPPRMRRMFTPEEGMTMFDRAVARSARSPSVRLIAASILSEEPRDPTADASEKGGHQTAPSEAELIEIKNGSTALAAAAAAGEKALTAVLGESRSGSSPGTT